MDHTIKLEQLLSNPPWMPAHEVQESLNKLRNSINETALNNERLNMRAEQVEKAIKELNESAKTQQENMEQLLALVRDINTNIKVANILGKLLMWFVGIAIPIVGYMWVRNHGG